MARFARLDVLNALTGDGLIPIFYNPDIEVAKNVADAVAHGGGRVLEFTNRGDDAIDVFRELIHYCADNHPQFVVGVGSIVDAPTAALYIMHGVNFIVAPTFNEDVARLCNRRKVAYIPGCGTLTEIQRAEEWGSELVKIFPAQEMGGPGFVKNVMAPCPWTRLVPAGGVDATEESIRAWFDAGVAAVGMGSKLIAKDRVAAGDWDGIAATTRQVLEWIRQARSG